MIRLSFKRMLALGAALCLCLALTPGAWAAGDAKPEYETMEWDGIISALLEEYGAAAEDVYAGYRNLITGEEHYYQGDDYVIAGSMYKVPLTMVYAELISSGELDWDDRFPNMSYQSVLDDTIINSSNDTAMFLWNNLGGYNNYRRACAPYMGEDPDNVDMIYYENNLFTPRQMICCLKNLYEGQEKFPGILETMQKAEPERFFRYQEPRFDIAHKYGYCHDDSGAHAYMNDCGLAFTDEPIALVMFTRDAPYPEELLTAYCTAMCDYTQYNTAQRQLAAVQPTPEPTAAPTATATPVPVQEAAEPVAAAAEAPAERAKLSLPVLPSALVILAVALALAAVVIGGRRYGLRPFWLTVSVLISGAAMLLCVLAVNTGTLYSKPQGDPQAVAAEFFDAVKAGDYSLAYAQLRDYSDLGLGKEPEGEAGRLAHSALLQSYDYQLIGPCRTDKLESAQQVSLTYLDLTGIQGAVQTETVKQLELLVQSLPRDQVYDANDQYLPEVANQAYIKAVKAILAHASEYYTQTEFTLSLAYSGGSWKIVTNPAMLKALNGGTGY